MFLELTGRISGTISRRAGAARAAALVFAVAAWCAAGHSRAAFEREPTLHAADLVSPSLLNGPGYTVLPEVPVVGYQARFTLRTRYGEIQADSVEMLALRIAEMPAVETLHGAQASDVLATAAAASVAGTGAALAQVARHPLKTVAGLPQGVARYFGERARKVGERTQKLGDRARRGMLQDGDPYDDAQGAMSAGRQPREGDRAWHEKPTREMLNLAKGELNYGRAKRDWARRLGIDPQTTNPLIRPRLDALAWIAVGGDRIAGLALGALGPATGEVLSMSGKLHDAIWELDPIDLRARNRARIATWCGDEILLRRFLQHRAFNAQLQTALVESVRALAPTRGCDALLETALMAASEQEARFVVNGLRLLLQHLGEDAAGGELLPLGASLIYRSPQGELLLPLAVDYLTWSAPMRDFFDNDGVAAPARTVLVTGSISMRAQRELTQRGWSLVPHLPYPDAPPYAPSPARPEPLAQRCGGCASRCAFVTPDYPAMARSRICAAPAMIS